jgi:ABC-type transport system substrate-binding protein
LIGQRLADRYEILSELGRGGMGVVYRAHDLALDRNVALKLLAPELAEDVRFRERFLRESRLAASLDHPAIIPIYDAGEVAGRLYIARRLVDGTDLKRLLEEEGVLDMERTLGLLEQVADALDAAHERGLVHRDVKPSNVLVDPRGHCYLADFGLSRRLADAPSGSGGAGRSLGTVDYVAPEQIRGEPLDGRADLYSLGCLLYECLAGRPPFARGSDTAIVFAHLEEDPPPLPGLDAVMQKALAKDPDNRYQSGHELVVAARDMLRTDTRSRRRALVSTAAVLAAAGAVIGGVLATRGPHTHAGSAARLESIALRPDSLNLVDARTRRIVDEVASGGAERLTHAATDIAFLDRSAWLLVGGENRLLRIDVASHDVTAVVRLPWAPTDRIAAGGGMVWVREARNLGIDVLGIDARTGHVAHRFPIGGSSIGIAYGAGSLWLVGGATVVRIDPRNGRTLHEFAATADWLVFAGGALWAASQDGSVWKIDPVENRITVHTKLHPWLSDVAVGGGFVWVSIVGENAVFKLSKNDLSVQDVLRSGADPERLSIGGGNVWVANTTANTISYLGQQSGARRAIATGAPPTTVAFRDGLVWTGAAARLPVLPPVALDLRISTPRPRVNVDPEQRVFPMDEQLSYATCANLLDYPDSSGPAGMRLAPEIAAAMPTISPDGRTYTFHIRSGYRFSPPSNEPVTAATFQHTIERTMGPKAQRPWEYLSDIVGETDFGAGKAPHISGIRAHGSTLSITLVRPAGDFLTRMALPVFCPVPRSTPLDPRRTPQPIPSAGPYYIASVEPHRIALLRNPNYAGSRPRRAARIVITDNTPTPRAVALVDRGRVDYLPPDFSGDPLAPGSTLDQRYGARSAAARAGAQRFYVHDRPVIDTIVFNTQRPLFRNVTLRRAVGYALDRPAMAKAYNDGPAARLVPAAVPGFDEAGVYPLAGPDLRRARTLAGSAHRRAILLAPCDPTVVPAATILRSNLAKLGIAVEIRTPRACDRDTVAAAFRHADLIIGTNLWRGPPDRDPAAFFDDAFHGGWQGAPLGPGPWYGAAFQQRLGTARGMTGTARVLAYRRLDDELARQAPLLVYGAYQYAEYFSARIGCKRFQAFYKFVDLGALCLRAK